ncbi:hypothetical protein ABG067_003272 [Albugo candida]
MPKIERIIDRDMRHNRVYYLIKWKGYGEENNTWESRVDLMKDGHGSVVRAFERERKKTEDIASLSDQSSPERSPLRIRKPSRTRKKSPARGRSPARSHIRSQTPSPRRSRISSSSSSLLLEEKHSISLNGGTSKTREYVESAAAKSSTPTRRSPRQHRSHMREIFESEVTKKLSKPPNVAAANTTLQNGDPENAQSIRIQRKTHRNYNGEPEVEEEELLEIYQTGGQSKYEILRRDEASGASSMYAKRKSTYQRRSWRHPSICVSGIIIALLPVLSTRWLLTQYWTFFENLGYIIPPVAYIGRVWLLFAVSLFLFMYNLHRKDDRVFAKWIAISMTWRTAGESVLLFDTSLQYQQVALAAFGIAAIALAISSYRVLRDHKHSNLALISLVMGFSGLLLSDSVLLETNNPSFILRIIVASISLMGVSYSPRLIQNE